MANEILDRDEKNVALITVLSEDFQTQVNLLSKIFGNIGTEKLTPQNRAPISLWS